MFCIYKITNTINSKIYIGQHNSTDLRYYHGSGDLIRAAYKKYGKDSFQKEIIETCSTQEETDLREKFWIAELNSTDRSIGYNISLGGRGVTFYRTEFNSSHLDPSICISNGGKTTPEETRRKQSESNRKKDAVKRRPKVYKCEADRKNAESVSRANKGKRKSIEHKRKLSEAQKGKKPGNALTIIIEDLIFIGVADAAKHCNMKKSTMRGRLKSKNPLFVNWYRADRKKILVEEGSIKVIKFIDSAVQ